MGGTIRLNHKKLSILQVRNGQTPGISSGSTSYTNMATIVVSESGIRDATLFFNVF